MKRVCVFCGSRPGARPQYLEVAKAFGRELASAGLGLVYGGASIGVMGALADSALAAGAKVIGVMPKSMVEREIAHGALTELRVVNSLAERKALMADLSDAFVALPGGFGTLDELFEMVTLGQLGLHLKPVGLLDVAGFYAPLLEWISRAVSDGFVPAEHARMFFAETEPRALIDRLTRSGR